MINNRVLKATSVTEKSAALMEKENKYTFIVSKSATKGQIKETIENLYSVNVINVNVLGNGGKSKRSLVGKKSVYKTSNIKKAIVQLKSGDSLKIYNC